MEEISALFHGFSVVLTPMNMVLMFVGIVLGKYAAWKSVTLGVAVNAIFFLMFEVWFKVPLYKGTLDPLRFLGY